MKLIDLITIVSDEDCFKSGYKLPLLAVDYLNELQIELYDDSVLIEYLFRFFNTKELVNPVLSGYVLMILDP